MSSFEGIDGSLPEDPIGLHGEQPLRPSISMAGPFVQTGIISGVDGSLPTQCSIDCVNMNGCLSK